MNHRSTLAVTAAALGTAALVAAGGLAYALRPDPATEVPALATTEPATDTQLREAAGTKVFFAHQSVGRDVLGSLPAMFEDRGVAAPAIIESHEPLDRKGGYLEQWNIGVNGDPMGKIEEFDHFVRAGIGENAEVVVLKFCFLDITAAHDVDAVLRSYTTMLDALARDHPDVAVVAATVPVTHERPLEWRAKALIGRDDGHAPENNIARERFNDALRERYAGPGELLDLASVMATTSDGVRHERTHDGSVYFTLEPQWARDPAHLNEAGGSFGAEVLMRTVAEARESGGIGG